MGLDCSRPCHETITEFYLPTGFGPGGGGGRHHQFPYHVDSWQTRDFDRFGEILSEYYSPRRQGQRGGGRGMGMMSPPGYEYAVGGGGGGGGEMGMGMGMGIGGPMQGPGIPYMKPTPSYFPWMNGMNNMNNMQPPPVNDFHNLKAGGGGRQGRYPTMSDFERMQEQIDDRFRRMAEEYQKNLVERDAFLFGSEAERRQEQYKQRMLKTLQEMMPQLSQLFAMGGQMGPGVGMGGGAGGMGGNPMMGMGMGMGGGMGAGGLGGGGGAAGMGGFGEMGGMNPMTGGPMGGGSPMAAMSPPMMGGGDPRMMGMGGGGGGFGGGMDGMRGGRRRGRRALNFGGGGGGFEDDDDDFGGGGGLGRNRRRRRRGAFGGDEDDDMFAGFGQEPRPSPRGPPPRPRPGQRPERGDGPFFDGGGGGGRLGAAFDAGLFDDRQQAMPSAPEQASKFGLRSDTGMRPVSGPPMSEHPSSAQDSTPGVFGSPPLGSMRGAPPSPFAADDFRSRPTPNLGPLGDPSTYGASAPPDLSPYGNAFNSSFVPGGVGGGGGPSSRPLSPVPGPGILRTGGEPRRPRLDRKNVSFEAEAKLSRSRSDEERRGEADAGSTLGPRDIK